MTDNLFPTDDLFKKETPKIKDPLEGANQSQFLPFTASGNSNHTSPFQGSTTAGGEGFPQLRFPEFSDNWAEKKVKDIFELTRGTVLSMTELSKTAENTFIYPVYSSQTKSNGLAGYYNKFLFENCITWTTDGAEAGDVNFRKGKFYCTNVCGVLKNSDGHANNFMAEILNSVSRNYVSYVGNPKLMNNVMSEIKITIPQVPEQTKIAEFLCSIDDKIANTEAQITKTQLWKKGLMQKMFV